MGLLEGKVALITGGGGGIGRGIARRFVREGATVVVAEYNEDYCATIRSELIDELGGRAEILKVDVRVKDQIQGAVEKTVELFGGIDILINNAFTLSPKVLLEQKTDEMLDATLHSGLWAGWWAMQAARPHMVARGGGSIVNFYSIDVETGAWLNSDYSITKSALRGLTRSAAHEWGRFNIRVNLLSPAAMGTVFQNGDPEEDIAPVAVFLASEMSRFVTGELINVDGGLHMPGYQSRPPNVAEMEQQVG